MYTHGKELGAKMKKRLVNKQELIGGVMFALFTMIGKIYASYGEEPGTIGKFSYVIGVVPAIIVLMVFYTFILHALFKRVKSLALSETENVKGFFDKHLFGIAVISMLIVWGLYIVAFYPGSVTYDGYYQINQALGINELNDHHPVFITFIYGAIFSIGQLVTDNFGIFCIILFEAVLNALVYSLCVKRIYSMGFSKKVCIFIIGFFAICPVFGFYVQAVVKDTVYTPLLVLYILFYLDVIDFNPNLNSKRINIKYVQLSVSGLLVCLTRHDGCYVVVLSLILLMFIHIKNSQKRKSILAVILSVLVLFTGYSKVISDVLGAKGSPVQESCSIVFQQTARYLREFPDEVTTEEYVAINNVLDANTIGDVFDPLLSDPVKSTFKSSVSKKDLVQYFETWFKMFLKHPTVYVDTFLQQCYGYFDPFHITGKETYQRYIIGAPVATGDLDIYYVLEGRLQYILNNNGDTWLTAPILKLFLSPGTYTWLVIGSILLLWKSRKYRQLVIFSIPILQILICVASPISGSLRYALPLTAMAPILFVWAIKKVRE